MKKIILMITVCLTVFLVSPLFAAKMVAKKPSARGVGPIRVEQRVAGKPGAVTSKKDCLKDCPCACKAHYSLCKVKDGSETCRGDYEVCLKKCL